ncbi:hypothetical protein ACH4VX_22990 [Streptomyces sp. NPDC020731]|uniref:hypothetical protein n=1 Tax=Streptomyces sp. NPDC020731 TaxID=3365085 RepID=UPI0037BAFF77
MDAWRSWTGFLLTCAVDVGPIFGPVVLVGPLGEGAPLLVRLNPLTNVLVRSLIRPLMSTIWRGKAPETWRAAPHRRALRGPAEPTVCVPYKSRAGRVTQAMATCCPIGQN